MDAFTAAPFADRSVVLLDFDGTIADTGPYIMRCARRALIECGYPNEAAGDLRCLIGPPLFNGFADLCHRPLEEGKRITFVYRRIFDTEAPPEYYPVFPGMRELIAGLHKQGRRVAVATSRLEETARYLIGTLDLPNFDAIVGRLEPGRDTKSESIRDALCQLGASPRDAVMVGDRLHDVLGAHEQGVSCIGVYTGGADEGEHERAGADFVAHDVAQVACALGVEL